MSAPSSTVVALQARLLRDKRELRRAVSSLADVAQAKLDVRRKINERPVLWLAAALALGLGLGARR